MQNPFDRDHQTSMGDLDLTYAAEGLTISGRLRMPQGPKGAEDARRLAQLLLEAAEFLARSDEIPEEEPRKIDSPFGHAFD